MAETTGKDALGALKTKIGPLPAWVWLAVFAAIWWYFQHKDSAGAGTAGQQTDPAGNTGVIDPETGYVYGSPEDIAARNANQGSGGGGSGGGGGYSSNAAWGVAAVNYLVARGIEPTEATNAIDRYLSGGKLTEKEQADVNLAIEGIGAPPTLPRPSSDGGGGGGGGGGGKPPKNLHLSQNNGTSVQVSWDLPGGVTGARWDVENHEGNSSGKVVDRFSTANTIANLGGALAHPAGLKRGTKYTVRIRESSPHGSWGQLSYVTKRA